MKTFWSVAALNMTTSYLLLGMLVNLNSYAATCNFHWEDSSVSCPATNSLPDILWLRRVCDQLKEVQKNIISVHKTSVITTSTRDGSSQTTLRKKASENNEQTSAISTIIKHGGIVLFMPLNQDGGSDVAVAICGGHGWHGHWEQLRVLKYIRNLQIVILEDEELPDEAIAHLEGIKKLTCLRISSSKLEDKSLEYLTKHKCLTQLEIDCPQITAKGLVCLRKIPSLSSLNLMRPDNITCHEMNACFEDIKGLKCMYHDYSKTKKMKN